MLNRLGRGEMPASRTVSDFRFLDDFVGFLGEALNRFTFLTACWLAQHFEDLLEPRDLALRLLRCSVNAPRSSSLDAFFAILGRALRIAFSA